MKNYFSNRSSQDIQKQLSSLKELMIFFKKECNIWAYLIYGTLLGSIRENNVIANDTDYDIALLLPGDTKEEILESFYNVAKILVEHKMLRKIWINDSPQIIINPNINQINKPLGQMHIQTPDGKYCIDVWLSWFKDNKYYLHKGVGGALKKDDIVPFKFNTIRDISFVVPNNSDNILAHVYGDTWREPQNIKSTRQKFTMRELYNEKTN